MPEREALEGESVSAISDRGGRGMAEWMALGLCSLFAFRGSGLWRRCIWECVGEVWMGVKFKDIKD